MIYMKYGFKHWYDVKEAAREILDKTHNERCTDEEVRELINNDETFRILANTVDKLQEVEKEKAEKETEITLLKNEKRNNNCCCCRCCK